MHIDGQGDRNPNDDRSWREPHDDGKSLVQHLSLRYGHAERAAPAHCSGNGASSACGELICGEKHAASSVVHRERVEAAPSTRLLTPARVAILPRMLNHISLGVNDLARSIAFHAAALG